MSLGLSYPTKISWGRVGEALSIMIFRQIPVFELGWRLSQPPQAELEELCRTSQKKTAFDEFACPHIGPLDGQRMLAAFDPSTCACVNTSDINPWRYYKKRRHSFCFSCENTRKYNREFISQTSCILPCKGTYRTQKKGRQMVVDGFKYLWCLERPDQIEWVVNLDPNSYSITEDDEGKHITWCPDPTCKTQYMWSGITQAFCIYLHRQFLGNMDDMDDTDYTDDTDDLDDLDDLDGLDDMSDMSGMGDISDLEEMEDTDDTDDMDAPLTSSCSPS